MEQGELVPDDVTVRMVMERLGRPDCERGAILDGFPRTLAQASALDEALTVERGAWSVKREAESDVAPRCTRKALLIQISDETVIERLSGRRICRDCQATYHIQFNPPQEPGHCDRCGGPLYQRADDRPEAVRNRLFVYYKQTAPLIGYYFAQDVLTEIDGEQGIEAMQADLLASCPVKAEGLKGVQSVP